MSETPTPAPAPAPAPASRAIRIGHVDDHPSMTSGLVANLAAMAPEFEFAGSGATVAELLSGPGADADVVLLDILGVGDLISNISTLREHGMQVLLFTQEAKAVPLRKAVEAGAMGVILKGDPNEALIEVIRTAHDGEVVVSSEMARTLLEDDNLMVKLADREVEVIEAIADGLTREETAQTLYITLNTVKEYINRAMRKYTAAGRPTSNETSLIREARRDGHIY